MHAYNGPQKMLKPFSDSAGGASGNSKFFKAFWDGGGGLAKRDLEELRLALSAILINGPRSEEGTKSYKTITRYASEIENYPLAVQKEVVHSLKALATIYGDSVGTFREFSRSLPGTIPFSSLVEAAHWELVELTSRETVRDVGWLEDIAKKNEHFSFSAALALGNIGEFSSLERVLKEGSQEVGIRIAASSLIRAGRRKAVVDELREAHLGKNRKADVLADEIAKNMTVLPLKAALAEGAANEAKGVVSLKRFLTQGKQGRIRAETVLFILDGAGADPGLN